MADQGDFGNEFGLNPDVSIFTLNDHELEVLHRQAPETESDGGWQGLLVTLQNLVEEGTTRIFLTKPIRARIRKYAFSYGKGGWEKRLVDAFGRHLGPRLDGVL
jgi:hypothetical protein